VQLGEGADGEKPKRVSLPRGASLEDLDLGQALKLLALPRALGVDPESGKPVTAGIGRFGPYVERAGQYQNLRAPDDVLTIDLPTALERLALKASRILKELGPVSEGGAEVKVMAGRFGPYVTDGSLLASLPKGADPEAMTLAEAVSLLAEKGKPRGGGKGRRGAARGKAAAAPAAKKATAKKAAPRAKVGKGGKAAAKKTTRKPAAR
jgi:DNA topoisomerase-1